MITAETGSTGADGANRTVMFTPKKLRRLKRAYECALRREQETGRDVFVFDGRKYVVAYARYLIERLETRLKKE